MSTPSNGVAVAPATLPDVHALMEGASVGMGYLDSGLRFVAGNRALARVFGLDALAGLALAELKPDGRQTAAIVEQVLRTGVAATVPMPTRRVSYYRVVALDGTPLGIGVVTSMEPGGAGRLAKFKLEAETDGLTSLVNHRAFQERLQVEYTRARRYGRPLALAMVDLDGFKQLNDSFGHQAGDAALQRVAGHLTAAARTTDTVARVGGDEFAMLLPETSVEEARILADRAHAAIRRDALGRFGQEFTISIGVCDLVFARGAEDLLRFADRALYWAKEHGRDQVCEYSPDRVKDLSRQQRGERLLQNKALAGIRSLARAIDAKDHSTLLHSERVASLAARLAEAMGWPPARVAELREKALIHDVGKIGIPLEILLRPSALTETEYDLIKTHAQLGAVIAADVLNDEQTLWLRGHHERIDGRGYPDGLRGDTIPEGAAILALADSWDVMTTERPYSRAMTPTEAIDECQRSAGSQFDPEVVAILTQPGFERVLRFFANEQATRDRNEARYADDPASMFYLQCECGTENCRATVTIPADEYRDVRQHERRYIVFPGHEIHEIESTLVTTENYVIVEKV